MNIEIYTLKVIFYVASLASPQIWKNYPSEESSTFIIHVKGWGLHKPPLHTPQLKVAKVGALTKAT
jgi:hypothetical protein